LCDFELRQESIGCFLADLVERLHAGDFSLSLEAKRNRESRWPGDDGALEVSAARDRGRSGEPTACMHTINHYCAYIHIQISLHNEVPSDGLQFRILYFMYCAFKFLIVM